MFSSRAASRIAVAGLVLGLSGAGVAAQQVPAAPSLEPPSLAPSVPDIAAPTPPAVEPSAGTAAPPAVAPNVGTGRLGPGGASGARSGGPAGRGRAERRLARWRGSVRNERSAGNAFGGGDAGRRRRDRGDPAGGFVALGHVHGRRLGGEVGHGRACLCLAGHLDDLDRQKHRADVQPDPAAARPRGDPRGAGPSQRRGGRCPGRADRRRRWCGRRKRRRRHRRARSATAAVRAACPGLLAAWRASRRQAGRRVAIGTGAAGDDRRHGAVRRPVRHGLGHHEQLHRHIEERRPPISRSSRPASPRRCWPPRSALSLRSGGGHLQRASPAPLRGYRALACRCLGRGASAWSAATSIIAVSPPQRRSRRRHSAMAGSQTRRTRTTISRRATRSTSRPSSTSCWCC